MASTGAVTAIVLFGIALSIVSSLYVVSYSNDNSLSTSLTQAQSQITYMEEHPSTTTTTSISTTTHTTTDTISTTYTTLETVTTTRSLYPPSSSSYTLTFVSGNTTQNVMSCGQTNYNVMLTYEVHAQLPNNGLLVWVRYNDGVVSSQSATMFPNQAYLSLSAQYTRTYSACGQTNAITSVSVWVTDQSDNVLSPTTILSIQ